MVIVIANGSIFIIVVVGFAHIFKHEYGIALGIRMNVECKKQNKNECCWDGNWYSGLHNIVNN